MRRFLIGQVCNALGVKAHVLRYWERHVELLSPAKDRSGRRVYTLRDVQLLFRLKYLIQTRKMSVEGASQKLVEEVQGGGQNRKAALDSLRGDLFRVHLGAQRLGARLAEAATEASPAPESARDAEKKRHPGYTGPGAGEEAVDEVAHPGSPGPGSPEMLSEALATALGSAGIPRRNRRGQTPPPDLDAARDLLSRQPMLVVSPAPAGGDRPETYPGLLPLLGRGGETVLDRIGRELRGLVRDYGQTPIWLIAAGPAVLPWIRAHLRRRDFYGIGENRVVVYAGGTGPGGTGPGGTGADRAAEAGPGLLQVLPVTNALPALPDLEFIARHLEAKAAVSVKAPVRTGTGERTGAGPGVAGGVGPSEAPGGPGGEPLSEALISLAALESLAVRRNLREDDILEGAALCARLELHRMVETGAESGHIFEVDGEREVAFLRSPADWDECSARVRVQERE
jgi:DNA-binding transcriptional MerR regulator